VLEQSRAPLFDALRRYVSEGVIPFHVPGHKQGRVGDGAFNDFVGNPVLSIDLTCLEELDHLSSPRSVILEAEQLAAEAFHADHAFFLCNGSSIAIQAMILASCSPGDKILVPRNAHKSVIAGIILSGAEPIYIQPVINDYLGIAMGITTEGVAEAITNHPDAVALFVINPTYYGVTSDLQKITDLAHHHGLMVLVDEAHGGHFYFHEEMPLTAMAAGADMAAVSTHKLTGSLTQTALLLLREHEKLGRARLRTVINLLQTTSPSYLLMASQDTARREMALHGHTLVTKALEVARWLRQELKEENGLYIFGDDIKGSPGCFNYDPTKLALCCRALGISGYEVDKILRQECRVQVELSDFYNALAIVTIGDDMQTAHQLRDAMRYLVQNYNTRTLHNVEGSMPPIPQLIVSPRFAYYSETVAVPLEEAEGEISAELAMAYPPGIPVICPGERISWDIIRYIQTMREANLNVQGTEDPEINQIRVLRRNLTRVYSKEK